jgi:hypothetical protein
MEISMVSTEFVPEFKKNSQLSCKTTMRQQCSAFAKTKNRQCKNLALPGSCYCILHLEKVPLIAGAVVGALLSLFVSVIYSLVMPSAERRELQSLKSMIQPVLELAHKGASEASDSDALTALVDEVKELRNAQAAVRTFETEVAITVYANWAEGVPPQAPGVIVIENTPANYLNIRLKDGSVKKALLHILGLPLISRLDDKASVIRYRTQARPGNWPIGEDSRLLHGCESGRCALYGINQSRVTDGQIGIRSVELYIFLNGQKRFEIYPKGDGMIRLAEADGGSPLIDFHGYNEFQAIF